MGSIARGFATTQMAYEEAYGQLFAMLDTLELRLSKRKFLLGDRITEADVRLFTTLVRFDAAYFGHFKCNRNRLVDFTELWDYTRALYQHQGIADTVRLDQIKTHYYGSHRTINPTGIVPNGPQIDFLAPTKRRPV
jgi:putative glutathione S-transferase